jgi:hypothetical protein
VVMRMVFWLDLMVKDQQLDFPQFSGHIYWNSRMHMCLWGRQVSGECEVYNGHFLGLTIAYPETKTKGNISFNP